MTITTPCPACGAAAAGNYCSECGASLDTRPCTHCEAQLSPGARFCHRCGQPAGPGATPPRESRAPWLVAAALAVLSLGLIGVTVWRDQPQPVAPPDMANPGAAGSGVASGGPIPVGPAPDISQMTPRERFDRLFNRIMTAAEQGDSAEVLRFTPMALGAYAQLDTIDADARYHAAVLQMQVGNTTAGRALADTILAEVPGHLFGYLIRGTAAKLDGDRAALDAARRDFLTHYDTESQANRVEYLEHRPVLQQFRTDAEAATTGSGEGA